MERLLEQLEQLFIAVHRSEDFDERGNNKPAALNALSDAYKYLAAGYLHKLANDVNDFSDGLVIVDLTDLMKQPDMSEFEDNG